MDQIRLNVICGSETFSYLGHDTAIRIGRSLKCEFNIPRVDLSREHCLLEIDENTFFITDLASKNGLTVNGKRLQPHVKTLVTEDSIVVLASIYHLKINSLTIMSKTKVLKNAVSPEIDTRTFQIELSDLIEKPQLRTPKKIKKNLKPESESYGKLKESLQMIIGFIAILGFALYQAFGE